MSKSIFILLLIFLSLEASTQDTTPPVDVDTMTTIHSEASILYTLTTLDNGSESFDVSGYLINGTTHEVFDTTFILSESEDKTVTYKHTEKGDEIYAILNGKTYQQRKTGFALTKADKISILKQIYSKIEYPESALARGQEGKVRLEFFIDEKGCIQDILLRSSSSSSSHSKFTQAAKRAAMEFDCQFPVFTNGVENLPSALVLPVTFRLN